MELQNISSYQTPSSTQKVTNVANGVEGGSPQTSSVKSSEKAVPVVSKVELAVQIEQLNRQLESLGQPSITFRIDESTSETVVNVVDKSTDELIRQFPTEGSLKVIKDIQAYLDRMEIDGSLNKESLTGSLFNEII